MKFVVNKSSWIPEYVDLWNIYIATYLLSFGKFVNFEIAKAKGMPPNGEHSKKATQEMCFFAKSCVL